MVVLSPGSVSPAMLRFLNYATPVIVVVYFIASNIFIRYSHNLDKRKPLSRKKYTLLVSLSTLTTITYATQGLQYVPHVSTAPDDGLIHAIASFLVWTTTSLVLSEHTLISRTVWTGTAAINAVLEVAVLIATRTSSRSRHWPYALPIQLLTTFSLLAFASSTLLVQSHQTESSASEDETQSLLSKKSMLSGQACDGNAAYSTIHNSNADRESITSSRSDFNASDDDSHSEDDDASIRKAQQERLASSSGWLDYLHPYKVFLPYLFPKKNRKLQLYFVIVLINILIQRALVILHPRQLGIIIDNLRQGGGSIPWKDIFVWFALEVASSQSCGVAAANELLENRLAAWSRQELTYASLEHVMGLSMSFHDAKDSGEVVKAIEQAESLNDLVRLLMTDLSPAVLDVTLSLIYVLLLFDIYATLIVIAMINGFVYATYKITLLATIARRISARKERDESKLVYESVGNWFTVAVFNQISLTLSKLSSVLTQRSKAGLRNDDLYTSIYFFQEGCEHLGRLAVTILAAHRIVQGRSSLGDLVALQSYWVTIAWPLYILGHNYRRISSSLVDAERLLQLFQVSPSITESPLATSLSHITGVVEFKDVSFAYEGRESTLSNINLSVSPGQTIALVGATGSGKSTLLKLLTRFHDPTIGSLTLDGHDLRAIKLNDLRDAFALVPQDPVLFNATLLENVRYGRPTASDHEVWDACKAASIHETILRLPKGYASTVGERGIKLSGGERQRIAIARALLRNSPIVLLDEATSAMDSATEGKIQDALAVLMKGRTSFVIAHRLSTVVGADVIVVMDKGKIVERGTHVELLEKEGGVYRELWKKQGGGCVLRDDADGKEQGEGSGEGGKKGL